jgi:5'-3' exoribonuclease 1
LQEKLEFEFCDSESLHNLAYRYIEGLQWVLHYYYSGVASWGWFYNYHYAPKISGELIFPLYCREHRFASRRECLFLHADLCHASTYKFKFELGKPFHPFEQLMGVLPDLSSSHIPPAFRDLLSDPTSPIIDFYPVDFIQDLNGKKQDWEAIVKIPFIDEQRLLKTMATRAPRLTAEENARNSFGDSWRFTYDDRTETVYPSSLPGFFPDLIHCHCKLEPFHLPTLEGGLSYIKGLVPGVLLGKDAISGFPSLHTIPYTGQLGFHGVSVFQSDSRKETMVVTIDHLYDGAKSEDVAGLLVGKRIYVGYPYLQEALVTAVSDELFRYEVDEGKSGGSAARVRSTPHPPAGVMAWKRTADRIEYVHSKKQACIIGNVELVVHAKSLKGEFWGLSSWLTRS